jgi:hypothetical protein
MTEVLGGGGRGGGRWSSGFLNESFEIFQAITLCFFCSCNKICDKTIARKITKRENSGCRKSSHGITEQGIGDKGKCRRMDALPHSQKRQQQWQQCRWEKGEYGNEGRRWSAIEGLSVCYCDVYKWLQQLLLYTEDDCERRAKGENNLQSQILIIGESNLSE